MRNNTNVDALRKSKHLKACSLNFWKNQNLKLTQRLKTSNQLNILPKSANSLLSKKPMLEMLFNQHSGLRTSALRSGLRTYLLSNSIHSNCWKLKALKLMNQQLWRFTLKRPKRLGIKSTKCINWCTLTRRTTWESSEESSGFQSELLKKKLLIQSLSNLYLQSQILQNPFVAKNQSQPSNLEPISTKSWRRTTLFQRVFMTWLLVSKISKLLNTLTGTVMQRL